MGVFNKIFGGASSIDNEIKRACDSDNLTNISTAIGGDKAKLGMALKYLSDKDNLSMKLRVLSLPVSEPGALMIALMALEPSDTPKINRLCMDGLNPVLHFSMYRGMEVCIRALAHSGANLDIVGLNGYTPLTMACECGLPETVKMLINNGAKALDKCDGSGWAPLHYACQLGDSETVEALIKAGANVNVISSDKLMPIHIAISTAQAARSSSTAPNGLAWSFEGAVRCIQLLAKNGADLNYVCPYGFSAMSFLKGIGAVK